MNGYGHRLTETVTTKYAIYLLTKEHIEKANYDLVTARFRCNDQSTSTAEKQWQPFKEDIVAAAEECILSMREANMDKWLNEECEKAIEKTNQQRLDYVSRSTRRERSYKQQKTIINKRLRKRRENT